MPGEHHPISLTARTDPAHAVQDRTSKSDPRRGKNHLLTPCSAQTLGQGTYAIVKECVSISTGKYYACKVSLVARGVRGGS
jgi:hypothetical protein